MQTLCPESGLQTAPNWPKIWKMTMTSQFSDMTSTSIFFDIVLFLLSSLVTGPSFMSISSLVSFCQGLIGNPEIGNTPVWVLPNIWKQGRVKNTKFGSKVSNKILLNAALCQSYSFYRFWVIKGKPTYGGKVTLIRPD